MKRIVCLLAAVGIVSLIGYGCKDNPPGPTDPNNKQNLMKPGSDMAPSPPANTPKPPK